MKDVFKVCLVVLILGVIVGTGKGIIDGIRESYPTWIEYELRPLIRSEVNRILCERGLSWDRPDVDHKKKKDHDQKNKNR